MTDSVARKAAGDTMAVVTLWLSWALLAPVTVGYRELPEPKHTCPVPYTQHGVGSDLKTYARRVDRCALESR